MDPNWEIILASKKEKKPPRLNAPGLIWLLIILALVIFGFTVSFFNKGNDLSVSQSPTPSETPVESRQPRIYTISYKNGVFSPTNLRIHAGDTVRFNNEGILPVRIISDEIVGFDSVGDIPQGSYFAFTFAAKGIFSYHNIQNSSESGTIIVR